LKEGIPSDVDFLKLSLSNGVFSRLSLDQNLAAVKRLGFENVEFNMKSVEKQDDDSTFPAEKLIKDCGLNCLTVHAASLHVEEESQIPKAIYYGQVSADFAHALAASVMVVHSNVSRKLPESLRHRFLVEIFGELSRYSRNLNVRLALENLSYASTGYGKNVVELEEILGIIDDGTMGVTLDFCHAEATGQTQNLLAEFHEKLCNIHLSNRAHRPFDSETPSLSVFLAELRKYGYDGPLTLELSSKCTLEEMLRTKKIVDETLSRNLGT
jgi:sugar phosphate isomerase/epimerase